MVLRLTQTGDQRYWVGGKSVDVINTPVEFIAPYRNLPRKTQEMLGWTLRNMTPLADVPLTYGDFLAILTYDTKRRGLFWPQLRFEIGKVYSKSQRIPASLRELQGVEVVQEGEPVEDKFLFSGRMTVGFHYYSDMARIPSIIGWGYDARHQLYDVDDRSIQAVKMKRDVFANLIEAQCGLEEIADIKRNRDAWRLTKEVLEAQRRAERVAGVGGVEQILATLLSQRE